MGDLFFLVVVTSLLAVFPAEGTLDQSELGPKIQEMVQMLHSTCVSKSGTDEDSIKKVINGEFIDESKIKFYMKCLLGESGVIDENGNFDMGIIAQLLPEKFLKRATEIIKMCVPKMNGITKLEDRIFAFYKCFYDRGPDIFIFF